MSRFIGAVILALMAQNAVAQERKPGVPDIPAMQFLWTRIKAALTGPNGEKYWESGMKGAEVPYLYGIVLSSTPKDQPNHLVLAMSDKSTPEVTLEIESHLKESVSDGAEIMFQGVATDFTKQPFNLTIRTDEAIRIHEPNRK
jgi:hypothetical protein